MGIVLILVIIVVANISVFLHGQLMGNRTLKSQRIMYIIVNAAIIVLALFYIITKGIDFPLPGKQRI